jgi:3-oxoacyl-[acyl-carrier protein] reductase
MQLPDLTMCGVDHAATLGSRAISRPMSGRRKVRIMTAGGDAGGRIRTALVTGGTGGMGRVIAAKLAADGFDVAVAYVGSVDLADATVKEIAEHGRHGAAFAADLADEEATSDLFDAVEDRFGHVDVVVHTAGINRPAALADLDLADFDEIHRVNVRGTFVVDQQAARRLREGGSIVNVSSSMVKVAPPALSAYVASKAAVDVLTRILAKELRGRDITVNAVAPGPTATAAFLDSTSAEEREQLAALPPLGRLGRPDDIAGVVSFLVGPTGRWVNGQVVYANGGLI